MTTYVGKVINFGADHQSAAWFKHGALHWQLANSINSSLMDQWGSSLANGGSLTKRYWNWTTETAPPGIPA